MLALWVSLRALFVARAEAVSFSWPLHRPGVFFLARWFVLPLLCGLVETPKKGECATASRSKRNMQYLFRWLLTAKRQLSIARLLSS